MKNPQLSGKRLQVLGEVVQADIVVSRILRRGNLFLPDGDSTLEPGDILLAVGSRASLDKLKLLVGDESPVDLKKFPGNLQSSQILVTQKRVIGRPLTELQLRQRFGVNITRIQRAGLEFVPNPEVHLQFGDKLTVVGEEDMIQQLSILLGNSMKRLEFPNIMPVFLGIIIGVLAGALPIFVPGMPVPLKLGIAGGPLIVAILMGRFGNVGRFSSYVSSSANLMLREVGIVLFLACVGLRAGSGFVTVLRSGDGLWWMGLGALITLVPVWLVALFSRLILKENFLVIAGLLSGSMTDPPALAFASEYLHSDAPALTYASVYPLVTFLRILSAQLLVLFFVR